ncbi:beta-1,3-galactosyltransferase 4-like [Varroa jacobsoni]|uniref:Hexosyltransferase n=1 Tax=Varroa destructor TaxID=109461 RepID=A0A7M7L7Z5_VARDE|nr:N-acetyllactosaminide beta-1,3-N-acetylglucosaminyltransferase 2-like isoform X1 [Varroa destructor]XP_022696429.1 beta-1,3-galactosyltransferase 4-like [Varroa jacobsoni]
MARIKRGFSLAALFCLAFFILVYNSVRLGTSSNASKRLLREGSPSRTIREKVLRTKGSGLRAFYDELSMLGYRKGDGGAVLFRQIVRKPSISQPVFLHVYVASSPSHDVRRNAIRETWGAQGKKNNVSLVFMIGKSELDNKIRREGDTYGDILQGDYRDTYDNLAFKSVSMLSHFSITYPHPTYIMKTDDDIFVNVPKLVNFLSTTHPLGIVGCDKSQELLPFGPMGESVPAALAISPFVVGAGYVIHRDTALSLPSGCLRSDPIPVEDVYLTSRCARAATPPTRVPTHHRGFSCGRWVQHPCELAHAFTGHHMSPQRMRAVMKTLSEGECSHPENEYLMH